MAQHAKVALSINWTVRFKNKAWWLAILPAICILVQSVLNVFGVTWDYSEWVGKIAAIIEAVFMLLALIGVVTDPTVDGFADSARALTYTEPAPNAEETKLVSEGGIGGTD